LISICEASLGDALQVKANGFGATVAALTGYRTGLLFPTTFAPAIDLAVRSSDHLALLLAAMEPFVAKVGECRGLQAAGQKDSSQVVPLELCNNTKT
jgi:hypothetical protein